VLFPEELELLGQVDGRSLVHLQCNSGQDSICLARRGAKVTGVDISDEAIEFARTLSRETGIAAHFERADVIEWLAATPSRFDIAFSSYGTIGWLSDLTAWASGVARVVTPGGALVLLEFHPILFSWDDARVWAFPYFEREAIAESEGVRDYVGRSGPGLAPMGLVEGDAFANPYPAHGFAWTIADTLNAMIRAGFVIERVEEWPYTNGCRFFDDQIYDPATRRWYDPPGKPAMPGMFGVRARRPA
jgi:SAM-dependent methyltransferase